jgi:hypothetical protein
LAIAGPDECWLWQGFKQKGYGYIRLKRKNMRVHRVVYEALRGPIPEGMQIDHLCRVRNCANPAHLEVVTQQENIRRGRVLITHCSKGHPYEGNTQYRIDRDGYQYRSCRICRKASLRRSYAAQQARAGK